MSKVVFFNIPAYGHTNPTLPIVKELINKGEEVIYYSFKDFKDKLEKIGCEYRSYNIDLSNIKEEELTEFPILFNVFMEATKYILEELLLRTIEDKPDYIIHDSLCVWGKYVAEILNIPAICSNSTFAFNENFINIPNEIFNMLPNLLSGDFKYILNGLKIKKSLTYKYKINNSNLLELLKNKENLNIVYTSKFFQPKGETFDNSYKFVGPSIGERNEELNLSLFNITNKIVYISLGTIFGDNEKFYNLCFNSFKGIDATFIVSLGKKLNPNIFTSIPNNFIVKDYVPQLEILKKASVFISHGGMNSVQESLFFGVPLIIYPQQKEQLMVAKRVEETSCGICLKKVSTNSLNKALKTILENKSFYENSSKISITLKDSGGYNKAVEEIFNYKIVNNI